MDQPMDQPMGQMTRSTLAAMTSGLLTVLLAVGCGARIENLRPETLPTTFRPGDPYPLTVGVAPFEGPAKRARGQQWSGWEEGLASFLRQEQVFAEVIHPYSGEQPVDMVLKGRVDPRWRSGGLANFLTYFPGGLLLVPNIRGTRWTYDVSVTIEMLDGRSNQAIGQIQSQTSHQLVHRSTSPGPFFGALVIVPGIIGGARSARPRDNYKSMMFSRAYTDLWRQVSGEMVAQSDQIMLAAKRSKPTPPKRRAAAPPPPRARPTPTPPPRSRAVRTPVAPPAASDLYSRRVAVVVGIDDYESWPDLGGAHGDAVRMAQYLRRTGFDEVLEIYDRDATRQRMLSVLGTELARLTDENAMALIYFAGHGQTETLPGGAKRGYVIPADAEVDDVFSTAISMQDLRHLSNRFTAKHVFYAIDACYSGLALTRGISVQSSAKDYLQKITSMPAVQIVTAGSEGEKAVEIGGQGLFTTYLLRALSGEADVDGDGVVTSSEIGAWVKPQVTRASGFRQTPQFGTIDGGGEVVFVTK